MKINKIKFQTMKKLLLLLLVLPMLLVYFRRGALMATLPFVLMLIPHNKAQADVWQDLWKTKDQQAAEAFAQENHEVAAALFESTGWQGAANYKSQNYEAAIAAYSADPSADGNYNRGNALAMAGNYEEAISAYDAAIMLDSNHEDAIKNKEIVEQLLEQQEAENGENQEGESEDNQSEQNSESESEEQQENSEEQDQQSQEGNEDQQEQEQQDQSRAHENPRLYRFNDIGLAAKRVFAAHPRQTGVQPIGDPEIKERNPHRNHNGSQGKSHFCKPLLRVKFGKRPLPLRMHPKTQVCHCIV